MKPEERNKQTPINEYFIDRVCPKRGRQAGLHRRPHHPRPALIEMGVTRQIYR